MYFVPYVTNQSGNKVPVEFVAAGPKDLATSLGDPEWQTDWESDYLSRFDKYAMKVDDSSHELVALLALEEDDRRLVVHIVYMESQPESNPTITAAKDDRRYLGIGKALVAFAIKTSIDRGYNGTVVMEAKTDALLQHYIHDFGGAAVRSLPGAGAPSVLIADEAAKKIFLDFLEE